MSTIREKEAILLYAILTRYKFSVGKIIENSILSYYRDGNRGLVPYPALITRIYILAGVEGDWEEETCLRTSPLILAGITKKPKNRGREREVEVAREEEENLEINKLWLIVQLKSKNRGRTV